MADLNVMTDLERELALEEGVFTRLPEFPIVNGRTALVTIDMQYLDAHPDHGLGKRAREKGKFDLIRPYFETVAEIVPRIQNLQAVARLTGVEVIHVRIAPNTEDTRDCPPVTRMRKLREPKGSRENEILDELKPQGDEISVAKITSSGFIGTPLELILRNLGVDTLVFCGVITNGCVESTARDARDLGFKPIIVSDACASWTRDMHERSLRFFAGSHGNVRAAAEVVAAFEAGGAK